MLRIRMYLLLNFISNTGLARYLVYYRVELGVCQPSFMMSPNFAAFMCQVCRLPPIMNVVGLEWESVNLRLNIE